MNKDSCGVLLCNLGTPASPGVRDVRRFLGEFLWDRRVVQAPRLPWWLVLNLVILNTRPKKTAAAYRKVWTPDGSPLLAVSMRQAGALREHLRQSGPGLPVEVAMRYGEPSMASAVDKLRAAGATRFIALPLYPQYSHTTTASVRDRLLELLPQDHFHIVHDYHDRADYIAALAESVTHHRASHPPAEKLVMSFHGIPQDYSDAGDPYRAQCETTAHALAERLGLGADDWLLTFQSRLGPKQWLKPYTDQTLRELAGRGVASVEVICPGFSADCLETLEEVAMENRDVFMEAGGREYRYIPCLNDSAPHIAMMARIISELTT